MGNVEVVAWKGGKRTIRYYVMMIYNGIAADVEERFRKAGYTEVSVRIV